MTAWSEGPHRALVCAALIASPAWMPAAIASSPGIVATIQDAAADARRELDELEKDFESANKAFQDASKEIRTALAAEKDEQKKKELQARIETLEAPAPKFLGRFEALARRAKGTDVALSAWLRVLQLDRGPSDAADRPAERAVTALLADHLASERLDEVLPGFAGVLGHEETLEALGKIRAASPHRPVQAAALFALASELEGRRASGDEKPKARAIYAELAEDFVDVTDRRGRSYAQMADGVLFKYDHLQVGKTAPDFEAVDENGARFKLSDYRGKVVFLDFWGFW